MRTAASSLLVLLAGPALAQAVAECDPVPPVTDLVEPWEETGLPLGAGAIRLALLHGAEEEGVRLLVLTLPPVEEEAPEGQPLAPERRCRIVAEGGLGFAGIEVGGAEIAEDPEAGTLTARLPVLRFVPESTELEELVLVLTFGVAEDSLLAELEVPEAPEGEPGDAEEPPEGEAAPEGPGESGEGSGPGQEIQQ